MLHYLLLLIALGILLLVPTTIAHGWSSFHQQPQSAELEKKLAGKKK